MIELLYNGANTVREIKFLDCKIIRVFESSDNKLRILEFHGTAGEELRLILPETCDVQGQEDVK